MAQTDKHREILIKRFNDYKNRFVDYIGKKEFEDICDLLGGEEKLISASYANMISSGYAYQGSLVRAALDIASYAFNVNNTLPADERWEPRSLVKVCLLCQISKAQIFIPNTNNWEVNNTSHHFLSQPYRQNQKTHVPYNLPMHLGRLPPPNELKICVLLYLDASSKSYS